RVPDDDIHARRKMEQWRLRRETNPEGLEHRVLFDLCCRLLERPGNMMNFVPKKLASRRKRIQAIPFGQPVLEGTTPGLVPLPGRPICRRELGGALAPTRAVADVLADPFQRHLRAVVGQVEEAASR